MTARTRIAAFETTGEAAGALLIAGTTSDAGKSVVTTGLCRAFARRGVQVAPYKAQNMSNNSMVCCGLDGHLAEIGRAQWVQAQAARVGPDPTMNPVLLEPGTDRRSHVVLLGRPAGELDSFDWESGRRHLGRVAHSAYDELAARHDVIIAEGAGSPTEINLRAGDYVNMGLARHANMPVVVVGDIDRGGVFAALYGTVALLEPADQKLVAGFVINKFRGDVGLLRPGLDELERLTGRRVYGTLPWEPGLWLDAEDSLAPESRRTEETAPQVVVEGEGRGQRARRVAVVRLPRISNFTDVDALGLEPDLDVVFVSSPRDLADADLVVLPGTRSTLADLAWLRSRGLDRALVEHTGRGRPLLGICGGFQMLGTTLTDQDGVETEAGMHVEGLGLLDAHRLHRREDPWSALRKGLRHARAWLPDAPRAGHGRPVGGIPGRCPLRERFRHHMARHLGRGCFSCRLPGRGARQRAVRCGFCCCSGTAPGPARRPGGATP